MPDPLPRGPKGPHSTVMMMLRPDRSAANAKRRYGTPYSIKVGKQEAVVTDDPATIKQLFTSSARLLAGNEMLEPLFGSHSVVTLDDPEHLRQRKLLLPPFHGDRMRLYRDVIVAAAEREVAQWPVGERFAVQQSMQAITLEVIMRAVFGVRGDRERVDEIATRLRRLLGGMSNLQMVKLQFSNPEGKGRFSPWRRFRGELLDPANEILYDEIRTHRADPDLGERDDILSLLLSARDEDGEGMTDVELRDELITLLIVGHDTTSTALSWTLERLTRHPDVLARLTEEVRAGDGDEYLDAVIKEALRMRPIVPAVARILTEPTELGGRVYDAGVQIAVSIYLTHHNPDVYPEPDRFRPERFLERPAGTYEWIPFGGGTRRCLGTAFATLEMKIVLSEILRRYDLVTTGEADERIVYHGVIFSPRKGARIEIAARADGGSDRESPVSAAA